jgi:LacI family transcriptional regulator
LEAEGFIECRPGCRPIVAARETFKVDPDVMLFRHVLLWMWPSVDHYMGSAILKGVQQKLSQSDVRVVVGHASATNWDAVIEAEASFLESALLDKQSVCVLTWYMGGEHNLPHLERLRAAGVPIVFLDRLPPSSFDADFVGTDNEVAARNGVAHLISLGHERIALVTNKDQVSTVLQRESGYRAALGEAGVSIDERYIYTDPIDGPEGAEMALDALLSLPAPPTAIFAVNDHIALQLFDALRARDIRIPEDISVLGFDGLLRWVPGGGFLTSMCQDFKRFGELAAELLLARSSSQLPAAHRHVLLEAPLVHQGSTGPAPSESVPRLTNLIGGGPNERSQA